MPVWHVARAPAEALYIGRPSRWGNPFAVGNHGDRGSTIARYRAWLWEQIRTGAIPIADLAELHGRDLACYCKPRACHGDVLEAAARWAAEYRGREDGAPPGGVGVPQSRGP